jgi:N-acetylglucosamine-6-sulfatase
MLLISGVAPREPGSAQAPSRPNILIILTDDQPVGLEKRMPTLQRELATKGLRFSSAIATDPLCCPSRATILTGKYAHNHGVFTNQAPSGVAAKFQQSGAEEHTIATALSSAGYSTGLFGKYFNGNTATHVPPGWQRWYAFAGDPMKPDSFAISSDGVRRVVSRRRWNETDLVALRAAQFIEAHQGGPWFAYVAPFAPHGPYGRPYVARRHADDFDGMPLPKPPSFNERDMRDKPKMYRREPLTRAEKLFFKRSYEGKLEALQGVDDLIARLITTLEATGELENTYILYLSDQGYLLGEHRMRGKERGYEESIRIPMYLTGPGVPSDVVRRQLVATNDVAPTIAELAGAQMSGTDGRALAPLLSESPPSQWRSALLIESYSPGARWRGLRTERYTYVEHPSGERELYDNETDRYQLESLHDDPAYANEMAALHTRLQALKRCAGESCRSAEN